MADEAEEGKSKKKSPLVLIIVVVVLLAGSVGGTLYFMGFFSGGGKEGEDAEEKEHAEEVMKETHYYTFEQPFTVNFETSTGLRFLQVKMEVMTHSADAVAEIVKHMPVVRNKMIFLLGNQKYEDLISREGKEKLQAQVLKDMRTVLEERTGSPSIEEVYFTNFVIQ